MSETPAVLSTESAISYKNGKPQWDVTKVTAYPMTIKRAVIHVYLTPYEKEELKTILRKAQSGYRREKRDVEIVREDRDIYAPLCDDHFVKFGNAFVGDRESSPDEQRAWLDAHPENKPSIVEFSFGGLGIEPPKEDENEKFDLSMELSDCIEAFQDLYDPATGEVVKVIQVHNHKHPTEGQFREYRNARRSKFIRKSTLWTISESHGTLEKLYDEVVTSIRGILVNGTDCGSTNKSDWVGSIPLWHKLLIVDQIFGEVVEKNV